MKPSERLIHRLVSEGVFPSVALSVRGETSGITIYRDADSAVVARSTHGVIDLLSAEKIVVTTDANGVLELGL